MALWNPTIDGLERFSCSKSWFSGFMVFSCLVLRSVHHYKRYSILQHLHLNVDQTWDQNANHRAVSFWMKGLFCVWQPQNQRSWWLVMIINIFFVTDSWKYEWTTNFWQNSWVDETTKSGMKPPFFGDTRSTWARGSLPRSCGWSWRGAQHGNAARRNKEPARPAIRGRSPRFCAIITAKEFPWTHVDATVQQNAKITKSIVKI